MNAHLCFLFLLLLLDFPELTGLLLFMGGKGGFEVFLFFYFLLWVGHSFSQ